LLNIFEEMVALYCCNSTDCITSILSQFNRLHHGYIAAILGRSSCKSKTQHCHSHFGETRHSRWIF